MDVPFSPQLCNAFWSDTGRRKELPLDPEVSGKQHGLAVQRSETQFLTLKKKKADILDTAGLLFHDCILRMSSIFIKGDLADSAFPL